MKSTVFTIDCQYVFPKFAASFLMVENGRAAFVENNTAHSVPLLLDALSRAGMKPEQVDYLIVTHVHLDHAGGTAALLEKCPNAKVLAHPRAARHLIDPSKLEASARHVYGNAIFEKLYGSVGPIPAGRLKEMADEEELAFGGRTLKFIHTRGHANHHFCVYDSGSNGIFTGDSFGLAYPALQKNGLFIFPSTSPTDFDPTEARASVAKILATGAERACLTHFGEITALREAATQLIEHLDFSEKLLEDAIRSPEPDAKLAKFCEDRLRSHFKNVLARRGLDEQPTWELIRFDIELNAAGLAYVAARRRAQPATG